ncbi:MAG: hypothetical protein JXB18_12840 [Sedimentisphaerales bacterium]|nr:hypothetical protein [Sedimentisphaerales bacterium]
MKRKKLNWLICFGFIVSLACSVDVSAAVLNFFTGAVSDDFTAPANWEIGTTAWQVPGDGTVPAALYGTSDSGYIKEKTGAHGVWEGNIKGAIAPDTQRATVYSGTSVTVGQVIVGSGYSCPDDGILDVHGTLSTTAFTIGQNGGDRLNWANGITNVYNGASLSVNGILWVGRNGWGSLNIFDGGYVTAVTVYIGRANGQGGGINLEGGVLRGNVFAIQDPGGISNAIWTLTIKHGELRIAGDITALVQTYIDAGKIQRSSDLGPEWYLRYDYNETNPGYTTVHMVEDPLLMFPRDGLTVRQNTNHLEWTLPEPNDPVTPSVVTCDVYFGSDPNILLDPKIVDKQAVESVSVTLGFDTTYYWKIDVYDSNISTTEPYYRSRVFTFNTLNVPPIVDAGEDVQSWLVGALRVVQLDGYVDDPDNSPDPVTQKWTVLSEPDPLNPAEFSDPNILNPTVTLNATGTYMLQFEGTDGEYLVADTMQIIVYLDACEHASYQPGFVWFSADYNHDCKVDILDFAEIAAQWLDWNYSIE